MEDQALVAAAHIAAQMVRVEDAGNGQVTDATNPAFAAAFVEALDGQLQSTGRMIDRVLEGAAPIDVTTRHRYTSRNHFELRDVSALLKA